MSSRNTRRALARNRRTDADNKIHRLPSFDAALAEIVSRDTSEAARILVNHLVIAEKWQEFDVDALKQREARLKKIKSGMGNQQTEELKIIRRNKSAGRQTSQLKKFLGAGEMLGHIDSSGISGQPRKMQYAITANRRMIQLLATTAFKLVTGQIEPTAFAPLVAKRRAPLLEAAK
jgi:hypothetical protein